MKIELKVAQQNKILRFNMLPMNLWKKFSQTFKVFCHINSASMLINLIEKPNLILTYFIVY